LVEPEKRGGTCLWRKKLLGRSTKNVVISYLF
jgi:hypothetical protein